MEARVRRDARRSFRDSLFGPRILELVQLPNELHLCVHLERRPRLVLRRPRHGRNRQTTDGNDLTRCLVNAITKELPSTNRRQLGSQSQWNKYRPSFSATSSLTWSRQRFFQCKRLRKSGRLAVDNVGNEALRLYGTNLHKDKVSETARRPLKFSCEYAR